MDDFNYLAASTEFRVTCPEPGTDTAQLLICAHNARRRASALETENLKLLSEIDEWKHASGTLYWSHVPTARDEPGWNLLVCLPDHPQQPKLQVIRLMDQAHGAQVLITAREKGGDEEITIADVIVPFRDDLGDCSICDGKGWIISSGGIGDDCPWCLGDKRSAMDEAREIACALYWSWLRSANGGGEKVISPLLTRREPFNSRETVNTDINNDDNLEDG